MDKYFNLYREMISLRGLSDHTLKSYCTYIRSYLHYLHDILHKRPEDVSWQELRDYIRWIQQERSLADRTINCVISQLRFFTMYVLHKPWDDTQLPKRRFNTYLPFVPSQEETFEFISTIPDIKQKAMAAVMYSSGLRISEVCHLRYETILTAHTCGSASAIPKTDRNAMLSSHNTPLIPLPHTGLNAEDLWDGFSQNRPILTGPSTPFSSPGTSTNTKTGSAGQDASPATPSAMPWAPIFTKTAQTCLPSRLSSAINPWNLPPFTSILPPRPFQGW